MRVEASDVVFPLLWSLDPDDERADPRHPRIAHQYSEAWLDGQFGRSPQCRIFQEAALSLAQTAYAWISTLS